MKNIGEKLKTSREEKGLSQDEVSEDLKISVTDLNNIEQGNKEKFKDNYLLKKYIYDYSKYLGLDSDAIIEEFNEFMFEFTSRIPTDVIDRINEQKEEEEKNKQALSPYTIDNRSIDDKRKKVIIVLISIVVIIIILALLFAGKDNTNISMLVE